MSEGRARERQRDREKKEAVGDAHTRMERGIRLSTGKRETARCGERERETVRHSSASLIIFPLDRVSRRARDSEREKRGAKNEKKLASAGETERQREGG